MRALDAAAAALTRDCGSDCACDNCRRARDAAEELVGKLVKFPMNTLHGKKTAAGVVKRVLPDGRLEIKAQLGGYYQVASEELIK
jgi:hypothetical protein